MHPVKDRGDAGALQLQARKRAQTPPQGQAFLVCGCKGTATFLHHQIFSELFSDIFFSGLKGVPLREHYILYMRAEECHFGSPGDACGSVRRCLRGREAMPAQA